MGLRVLLWSCLVGVVMMTVGAVRPALAGEGCLKLTPDKDQFEVKSFIASDPCVKRYSIKRVLGSIYESLGNFTEARRWDQLALDQLLKEGYDHNLGPDSEKLPSREGNDVVWRSVVLTDEQKRAAVDNEVTLLRYLIAELDRRSGQHP